MTPTGTVAAALPAATTPTKTCPDCGGPWTPEDLRGVITFRHRRPCSIDNADIGRACNDDALRDGGNPWTRDTITRPTTPDEARLMRAAGLTPTTSIAVDWTTGVRRRTPITTP